jgi:hypothetical protein
MKKRKKRNKPPTLEDVNNIKIRSELAISAHFRTSAGVMKDKKTDKKIDRRNARKAEKGLREDYLTSC